MKRLMKESYEVSDDLAKRLNSILADEFLAAEAYRLAIVAMKGNKQHRLEEIAEKNGEDELEDHFKNLSDWMQSKNIKVVTDTDEMKEITNGTVLKFTDGMSTTEIVDKLILSEEEAIAVYEDTIPHTELDLNTMLCGFLKDEREHLKELVDCRDEMGGGDKASEPKHKIYEDRKMKRINESDGEIFHVTDVAWDTDGVSPRRLGLPVGKRVITVEVPYDVIEGGYDEVEEYISDFLSDEYEFCHGGFSCPELDAMLG